jgi:dipeptidyl aminopeptidase/acylaminoacyl peptidase
MRPLAAGYWLLARQKITVMKNMKKNRIIKKTFKHPLIRIGSLLILGLCIVASVDLSFAVQQTAMIPLEDFFKNPKRTSFEISPDGKHLAFLKSWQNRLNVYVQKVDDDKAVRITHSIHRDIMWFGWANDRRIAYIQDKEGDENWQAYAVDIDGTNFLALTPFNGVTVRLVDGLEEDDNHALIALNRRDKRIFDVYLLNVNTAELKLVAENPGNITRWVTDNDGKLRVAVATDGVHKTLLYRKTESERFKEIITTDFKNRIRPLFFTFDNRFLYVSSNVNRNTIAIYKYDIENGKHLELIYEHPQVDVYRLMRSKKRKVITGVGYITSKHHFYFFDEKRKKFQEMLEQRFPVHEVFISNHSKDETKMVIRTYSDRSLGAYFYYDHLHKKFKKLADVSPWIDENNMAAMQPIQYSSRDGLTIHGYLTLPKGVAPQNLPLVVNPHGGPWARNRWRFDPQVQFLANRGFAVLQVNFRGSTGYGKAFWQAGFKEWGKKMLDDVTDGVHWLIKEDIADPERIGIYGASFGGYTALAGLAFTPDLYACGVDYVGISNIFTWLNSIPAYWEPARQMFYEMVGDPEKDKDLLRAASPLFHAGKIKAPLFVAQGANDPRVKKAESDQIVEAVKKHGIKVQYMVKDNEGHGFRNEENRFEFYRAMEDFFAKHLGSQKKAQ